MKKKLHLYITILCAFLCNVLILAAQNEATFKEFKGIIVDEATNESLIFTDLVVTNSNISTVSNSDGEFILKIPSSLTDGMVIVSCLGYEKKEIPISSLKNDIKIKLTQAVTELNAINIASYKNAKELLKITLSKRHSIYNNDNTLMTAFYRETIKNRKKNALLSEAIVQIRKRPYESTQKDGIELIKSRKKTNYKRLDTIAVKLRGGPFSNLYTDIIKYPEHIFTKEDIDYYNFTFSKPTQINKNMVYVINFKQKANVITPLYYGKLYIDSETLALTSAVFSLNVENKDLASEFFIRKKPLTADVYPTKATYRINYRTKNGKWQYAYSNISLAFKVNWKKKLFNSIYTLNSEMAVTDWEINHAKLTKIRKNILRPSTILADKSSGFSDPEFWGQYNIIEPEKSIESAIKKIQKQLDKNRA